MSEKPQKSDVTDYSKTLFLPQTEFPMRAGLPQREPEILNYWNEIDLYEKLRTDAAGRAKFALRLARSCFAIRVVPGAMLVLFLRYPVEFIVKLVLQLPR